MGRFSARGPRQPGRHALEAALFDRWVDGHAPELYRFAYRLCGERATAEDLVQEAFYDVWRQRESLKAVREPRAWLFLILRRRYLRLRRMEQRRPWLVSLAADRVPSAQTPRPDERIETADSLQSALDGMSDLFKLPLLMVFAQGMTCAQAAEQLDVPLGTVLSRIHRGKKQLREAIGRQDRVLASEQRGPDAGTRGELPRLRIGGA